MQQDQEIADLLRDLVRDDRERRDDAELGALQERGGDEHAVDEVVQGVADDDQRAAAAVVVRLLVRIVRPRSSRVWQCRQSSSFSSTKKPRMPARMAAAACARRALLERVRDHVEERRAEQRADRVATRASGSTLARSASANAASATESVPPAKLAARIQPSVMESSDSRSAR